MRKTVAVLLSAIFVLSLFPCIHTGAAEDDMYCFVEPVEHRKIIPAGYIPVYNRADLEKMRTNPTGKFLLMNDIDLYYEEFSPIGTVGTDVSPSDAADAFSGVFDGNGYAVINFTAAIKDETHKYISSGFFAVLAGEVKNLLIQGDLSAAVNSNANANVGGIAGTMTPDAKIENCIAKTDIFCSGGVSNSGGISGYGAGKIWYCRNYGAVTSASSAGGIAGVMNGGEIYRCHNTGAISVTCDGTGCHAGGICGKSDAFCVKYCDNTGSIEARARSEARAGGIVGTLMDNKTVENCWNNGKVYAGSNTQKKVTCFAESGGIVGSAEDGSKISKCYNNSLVEAYANNTDYEGVYAYSGGIIGAGEAGANVFVNDTFNGGEIKAEADYFYGAASACVGGIAGALFSTMCSISRCYSTGTYHAKSRAIYLGAIVGYIEGGCLRNCYWNAGSKSAAGRKVNSVAEQGCAALTDEQMKSRDSFEGFLFGHIWTMEGDPGYEYPELTDVTYRTTNSPCAHESYGEWTETRKATCKQEGEAMRECTVCGSRQYKTLPKTAHTWGDWVEEKAEGCETHVKHTRTCSVCGETETDVTSSTLSEWIIDKPATHTEPGHRYKKCTVCGEVMTEEEIPPEGHTYVKKVVEPTCDAYGYTEMTCSCGDTHRYEYKDPTGHMWSDWTMYKQGEGYSAVGRRTCERCGKTEEIFNITEIYAPQRSTTKGMIVDLPVYVKNNAGISYIGIRFEYDQTVMSLEEVTGGTVFGTMEQSEENRPLTVVLSGAGQNVESDADGRLFTLRFKVSDTADIGYYAIKAHVTECNNYDEEDVPVAVNPLTVNIVNFVPGDATGDKEIDGRDVTRILKYLANYDYSTCTSSISVEPGADATADGEIDGRDVTRLLKYLAEFDYETGRSSILLG